MLITDKGSIKRLGAAEASLYSLMNTSEALHYRYTCFALCESSKAKCRTKRSELQREGDQKVKNTWVRTVSKQHSSTGELSDGANVLI
jgi:hypothetical protein